jgi:NAD(P)-dependent dehydrogenase (short-subunit alcohol dehydrogenase family)
MALSNQTALITGAGRGLGRAMAEALAQAGAAVAIADRMEAEAREAAAAITAAGGRALALIGDVTDEAFAQECFARAQSELGPISLLVCNAGLGGLAPLHTSDPRRWWRVFEVNVKGVYLFARAALTLFQAQGGGRIIITASEAGGRGVANSSAYSASKGAAILLTESLAQEVAPTNVQVFAIHPGGVLTPGSSAGLRPDSPLPDSMKQEIRTLLCDPPTLAAHLVLRLASGEADALSGSYVSVHDDLSVLIEERRRQGLRLQSI